MKSIPVLGLVLLLAVSARPAGAQDTYVPASLPALPAALTPAAASAPGGPAAFERRRNRALGAAVGAVIGAVAGSLVTDVAVCNHPGEGGAEDICKAMGVGLGAVLGAIVGGILGVPVRWAGSR